MVGHLENIETLFNYALEVILPEKLIDLLYERIGRLVESQITQRDVENFVSYFKFVFSSPMIPKELMLDVKLVQYFVNRTYAGFDTETVDLRIGKIYEYIKGKIGEGTEINKKSLEILEKALNKEGRPTFDKLRERVLIATILKWLQGPLKSQVSKELDDYIVFLATTFGQYETQRVLNVEKELHELSKKDLNVILNNYPGFEVSLMEAAKAVRSARASVRKGSTPREQFRVVFDSLDNLIKKQQQGKMEDISAFKDKLIVSTALIYLQDESVDKDFEVKTLIQLFVTLYYQFRDQRYPAQNVPRS